MKNTLLLFLMILCVFGGSSLLAQGFSINKSSIKIERAFVKAPVFNVAQRTYKALTKPASEVRWLQFLVSYEPKSAGSKTVWEDDLVIEMVVLLPAKKNQGYGDVIVMQGKQVLYSVPGDGKQHYALFLIPPSLLKKYTSLTKFDSRTADNSVYAAVIFRRGRNNQILATGYAQMKNKSVSEISRLFEQYHKSKIGVMKVDNGILPKEKTPWQWIDMDIFDTPKSMIEGTK